MARPSNNKTQLNTDVNDLFNTRNAADFQKKLNAISQKYNKLLAQEKLREEYNKRVLNNTILIGQVNDDILRTYLSQTDETKKHNEGLNNTLSLVTRISTGLADGLNWLDSIDGAIKTANLSMGLTRGLAMEVRNNLIEIGGYAASLGSSIKDVTESQMAYNNSLGRNVILNVKNLKALVSINRGLGLSNEFSGEIAGNFERIGYNVSNTKDFIEDTIVSSGKFGVNVNKVMKTMNDGFMRANSFNFSKGISAFRDMVVYAEKFKINVDSAFNSMEMARTLEGSMEMAAKLMVMGGEFSKQNPFELAFLARNRPEEYTKKMNEMTKGVYFFNQQTKQFQSSAFELDRLRAVAEATGVPFQELNEQAMRFAQVNLAKSKLIGINKEDKEFISSIAQFDAKTGKFTVSINGDPVDIQKLNGESIRAYKEMTKSLEDRSKDAMTFNETYTVFIEEFKALFLPTLKVLNSALINIREIVGDTGGAILGGVALAIPLVSSLLSGMNGMVNNLRNLIPSLSNLFKGSGSGGSPVPPTLNPASGGGKGFSFNATGAATALATGAAFLMVAKGVSMMAEAYEKLDTKKIDQLNMSLGIIGLAGVGAAFALGSLAGVASVAWAPLLALGGSMVLIGVGAMAVGKGIEFVTSGIGNLIEKAGVGIMNIGKGIEFASNGFGNLINNVKSISTTDLLGIGAGLAGISLGIASFANPFTALGMAGFGTFIGLIGKAQTPLDNLSRSVLGLNTLNQNYTGINTVLSNIQKLNTSDSGILGELRKVISELNNMGSNTMPWLKELKDTLSKPLKVEFDSNSMKQAIDVKLYLDSELIYRNTLSRLPKDISMIEKNRMNSSKLKVFYDQ